MRLAGQVKQGYYPCPEEALRLMLEHLLPPPVPDRCTLIDPCAGEGRAVIQLADGLGIPRKNVYAVELNVARSKKIAEAFPDINLLGPCSFGAARITRHSFSMLYLNPPFDDEMGGGQREEVAFLKHAADLLIPGGILVLVCPLNQVYKGRMCGILDTWFDRIEVFVFPPRIRKFGECVVFGVRRKQGLPNHEIYARGKLHRSGIWSKTIFGATDPIYGELAQLGTPQFDQWSYGRPIALSRRDKIDRWQLPLVVNGPARFEKKSLTQEEIEGLLESSPIYRVLAARTRRAGRRPPLPLNRGHTSLLLLTGLLDGYVPSDPPHVVRGHCAKHWGKKRVEHYETPGGKLVTKVRSTQSPLPIVRAAWPDGTIVTYQEAQAPEETADQLDLETDTPTEEHDE